jgi:hypothetical protein
MSRSRSPSSSPDPPVFVAHPLCPPHLRTIVEEAVESCDSAWLLPPQYGEIFQTAKECLRRLQSYALSHGFTVIILTSKSTRTQFACIHSGTETRNWRNLEDHLIKDEEDTVVSKRKRDETSSNAKSYT